MIERTINTIKNVEFLYFYVLLLIFTPIVFNIYYKLLVNNMLIDRYPIKKAEY